MKKTSTPQSRRKRCIGARRHDICLIIPLVSALGFTLSANAAPGDETSKIFTVINPNDDGSGSLRQAIIDSNNSPGADTIEFDPQLAGQTISLISGELLIADGVEIKGLGADILTVSGNNQSRIFNIEGTDKPVRIDGLTITDGKHQGRRGAFPGSGIFNSGTLTVANCIITSNEGSGISHRSFRNFDTLTVVNSRISDNTSSGIPGNTSSGIDISDHSIAEITDSTISNNSGSGILVIDSRVKVVNSTLSDNISGITVLDGSAEVIDSTLSSNSNDSPNSTGGGIDFRSIEPDEGIFPRTLTVTNTTISGNTAVRGGGLYVSNGFEEEDRPASMAIVLNNATITGNSAIQEGGGVLVETDLDFIQFTQVNVNTTIVAGNSGPKPDAVGNFMSNGHNIIGVVGNSQGFEEDLVEPNIANILDPTLKSNGGATQTHALVSNSLAIDAIGADCPPPATDQRGVQRPQGAACDIGAFEFQQPDLTMCEMRTQYEPGRCKGEFEVFSLEDLEAYKASNFGRQDGNTYQDLGIKADLGGAGAILDIESPCKIFVSSGVTLSGDFVSLDGREGVQASVIEMDSRGSACLLSETGGAKFKPNSGISANDFVLQANRIAKVGRDSQVNIENSLTIQSTGPKFDSRAIIANGASLFAGSDMILSSEKGWRTVIDENVTIDVIGNLHMSAKKRGRCRVNKSAEISFGNKSGICGPRLP